MLRNVWSKASLEWDAKQSIRKLDQSSESNLNFSKTDHNKNLPGSVNRDSGIFEDIHCLNSSEEEEENEDYFLPDFDLGEKDREDYFQHGLDSSEEDKDQENYLQPGAFFTEEDKLNYFYHEDNSSEEELSTHCDSDRELHASLSSLNTAVASTSLSISLSSLTTSTDEEEGASDFDLSSSDSEALSEDSSEEENDSSNSFGYHSLLNDLSPECNATDIFDFQELKISSNGEEAHNPEISSLSNFVDNSHALEQTSVSPALSLYDNIHFTSHSQCGTSSICSSLEPSDNSSSDDENPSDIELKMAETEVKMCDALLSSGCEELALRASKMRFQNPDNVSDAINLKQQMHSNDFKPPNNNLVNYHTYHVGANNEKRSPRKTDLNLPLEINTQRQPSWKDNRYSSSIESPIVDAYEKECRDAPEKMAKELENKEKELENKQRVLKNKQQELENELQELENKQQALFDKKKQEAEDRISEEISEMEIEHDQDLLAFEEVMKQAIRNKEAGAYNDGRKMSFDWNDDYSMRHRPSPQQRRRERNALRRNFGSHTSGSKNSSSSPEEGEFDVYTMESVLPSIDWDTIEEHFKTSQEEEEKRRRTDREEIRKKLAMGTDDEDDRNIRKPSLHSRLQNSKNLQICFMNETASDCESQCSDTESTQDRIGLDELESSKDLKEKESKPKDFLSHQAKLQEDARLALGQAKEMARMQMQLEKLNQMKSPITEIVQSSFNKVGFPCPANKRRMSRQVLSDMNVAQLQVIVNEFHTQIENLNEVLVQLLLQRDDLHMEQDSMLVDIEDLNKHLGAKEGCLLLKQENKFSKNNKRLPKSSKLRRYINE